MAVVAINGKIHSGKDTVAKIWHCLEAGSHIDDIPRVIQEDLTLPRHHETYWMPRMFAAKLKKIVAEMLGVSVEQLNDTAYKKSLLSDSWQLYNCYVNGVLKRSAVTEAEAKEFASYSNSYVTTTYKKTERTVRWLLQTVGTDLFRNQIHVNIHVNMLFAEYASNDELKYYKRFWDENKHFSEMYHHRACRECRKSYSGFKRQLRCRECIEKHPIFYPNWLVTDLRFPNESAAIVGYGGLRIKVERPFAHRFPEYAFLVAPDWRDKFYGIPEGLEQHAPKELMEMLQHPSETSLDGDGLDELIFNDAGLPELVQKVKEIMIKHNHLHESTTESNHA